MKTFSYMVSNNIQLTEYEVELMIELLGYKCRLATIQKLRRKLSLISLLSNYSIFERIQFTDNDIQYFAGQSYPDEIRTIRQLILK